MFKKHDGIHLFLADLEEKHAGTSESLNSDDKRIGHGKNMELPYPPPPPPSTETLPLRGIHGPRTDFFPRIRSQLASMEQQTAIEGKKTSVGLIVALLTAAILGLIVSILLQTALSPFVGPEALLVLVAPLTEEPAKAIGMFIVALLMWKSVPNRRYGAALGAASGLGFGVAESILYIYGLVVSNSLGDVLIRIIVTPLMHPLWSAFVGIGVFAFLAKRPLGTVGQNVTPGLGFLFLATGIVNHIIWNALAVLSGLGYVAIAINILAVFPLFAVVIRDFLGGHFNFQDFYKPLPEPVTGYPQAPLPPPPPPPPI